MKNTPLSLILCICLFLFCSCVNKQNVYVVGKKTITNSKIDCQAIHPVDSIKGDCSQAVYAIPCVIDSIAILKIDSPSHCYRVLNLTTLDYFDFLLKGRGPEEVINCMTSRVKKVDGTPVMDVTAMNEHLLLSINLKETMQTKKAEISERVSIPEDATFSFLLDSIIVSEVLFDEDLISIKVYNKQDLSLISSTQIYGDNPHLSCYPLYYSAKHIKPDGSRISMSMLNFDRINIFDLKGSDNYSITSSKRTFDQKIIDRAFSSNIFCDYTYYKTSCVTDKYIYALYYNCSNEDLDMASPILQKFTWEGELVNAYLINEPLCSIAISEDDSTLYGISQEEMIYVYSL